MLPKNKRLNLKKDFKRVASGKKLENNLVKLFIKPGDLLYSRIGIAVSKTVFKKAVDRNRARRLLSKGFENLYDRFPDGINIIALPKKEMVECSSDQVTRSLEELFKKGGILK